MWCCVAYGAQTCFVTKSYAYINSMTTTWVWKPFYRYFVHFRRSWDTKATTINAFTTFLLLSFSKAYLYPSHSCTFVVHYGILLKVFLVLQCTVECSTQEFSAHLSNLFRDITRMEPMEFNLPHFK